MEENEIEIDEAYVLVANQQRVSRNLRFRWYIDALSNPEAENFYDTKEQLHVIGQVPQRESITPKTDVQFIFQRYRYVFLFDFSASGNFPPKFRFTEITDPPTLTNRRNFRYIESFDTPKISIHRKFRFAENFDSPKSPIQRH